MNAHVGRNDEYARPTAFGSMPNVELKCPVSCAGGSHAAKTLRGLALRREAELALIKH
jgi:hypothetical protein